MSVDAKLAELLTMMDATPHMSTLTPEAARGEMRKLAVEMRPPETRVEVASVEEVTVAGAQAALPARVYRPAVDGPVPTTVVFHGGGFVIGDLDTHDNMSRAICAGANTVVVSVDYRLAPEHPFPAAAEDAIAAARDVLIREAEFGGDGRVAVAGDSAGGNLSAIAAQQVEGLVAQFLIYPATDVVGEYESRQTNAEGYFLDAALLLYFIEHYASGGGDLASPMASPAHGELGGLPDAVIVTAEFDPLRDEGKAYADALTAAGSAVDYQEYAGMIHGFIDMDFISPAAKEARDDAIARFAALLAR